MVAGWNIETKQTFHVFLLFFIGGWVFGTLLGPEGTPVFGLLSLAAPGLDRLTLHVLPACLVGVGVVVVDVGWGVVVC